MDKILSCLILIAVVSLASSSDYRAIPTDKCTASGLICLDCKTLATCIKSNDQWEAYPVETCDKEGFFCNLDEKTCSSKQGECNPGETNPSDPTEFTCNNQGVFPDPLTCKQYHMCYKNGVQLIRIDVDCENMGFSVKTGDCSLPLNHSTCYDKVWNCSTAGDIHAWPGNNNIYYICQVITVEESANLLHPALHRCPDDKVFVDGECVLRYGYKCERPGLFPDRTNCLIYYYCDAMLRAQRLQCPSGTYFSDSKKSCIRGTC